MIEIIFGLHVTINVAQIDSTKMLKRFDETGIQLLSIIFIFFIFCILPIFVFGPGLK